MNLLITTFALAAALSACNGCDSADPVVLPSGDASDPDVVNAPPDVPYDIGGGDWEWETRGIGGGGVFLSAAINPHDGDELSIGSDMGTFFRSGDFGRTWFTPRHDTVRGSDFAAFRWTRDPNVVFAIDARGWQGQHPLRSEDGGLTWSRMSPDPTNGAAWALHVDPEHSERMLIANYSELFASTDGGSSWRSVHANDPGLGLHVAGVAWTPTGAIVATTHHVLVSVDGVVSFDDVPLPPAFDAFALGAMTGAANDDTTRIWVVPRHRGTVWPGLRANQTAAYQGVWRADFDGASATWTEVTPDAPRFQGFIVASAARDTDTVYLSGARTENGMPDVLRSRDGGASWESTFVTRNNANIASGWCGDGGDTNYWWSNAPLTLAVSPTDPERVVIGDFGFVHVSADGGTTWRQAYVDVRDQHAPGERTPSGDAYRGIGLENTSSWWLHWTPDRLIAAFSDIRGISSLDGGQSWISGVGAGMPDNSTYHIVEHPVSGRLYAATSTLHDIYQSTFLTDERLDPGDGRILVSDDGGASWQVLHEMQNPVVWLALHPDNPERLYAAVVDSAVGGVWVTDAASDPTVEWTRLPQPERTAGHPYNIRILSDGTLVTTWSGRMIGDAFDTSSGVFVSDDDGQTWRDASHPDMHRWTRDVVIDPHDPTESTWYVGVFSHWGSIPNEVGGLFRSRDRGETWQRLNDLYRVESITIDPEDPNNAFVTTETQGLFHTTSLHHESPTFAPVLTYPFAHPTRTFFSPDNDEVWATSFGGGLRVWRRPGRD